MDDRVILDVIHGIVAEEHHLRERREAGDLSEGAEVTRLDELERSLDQMWDLLRRRRALRAAGLDPDTAEERPSMQVESYIQ
jgi:hypothetical protein